MQCHWPRLQGEGVTHAHSRWRTGLSPHSLRRKPGGTFLCVMSNSRAGAGNLLPRGPLLPMTSCLKERCRWKGMEADGVEADEDGGGPFPVYTPAPRLPLG